jgi:hypothetical protein
MVSNGLFPDMALVIEYSAFTSPPLLQQARMAIFFDEISERLIGSPVHRHVIFR